MKCWRGRGMRRVVGRTIAVSCLLHAGMASAAETKLVFMIGEDEYHTGETLPKLAETELRPRGYAVSIISADPVHKNSFPGLTEALKDADLLFLSVRRRFPPKEQLEAVQAYLMSGKPLVGIRTASHAFAVARDQSLDDPSLAAWQDFDPQVLGGHYKTYYRDEYKTIVSIPPGTEGHPILQGISVQKLLGNAQLYIVSPVEPDVDVLLTGTTLVKVGNNIECRSEPVAWTRLYGPNRARIFYTSLGDAEDFKNPEFRRLLLNGIAWAAGVKAE